MIAEVTLLAPEELAVALPTPLSRLASAIPLAQDAFLLAQEAAGEPPSIMVQILNNPLTLIMGLFFLFYFIVLLPERRRKADEARLMSTLKKNDRIITIGGIHGTIVAAASDSQVVTIRIDDNTRMRINRTAIAKIVTDKESADGKSKESASPTNDT